jgi:hypothetical protein
MTDVEETASCSAIRSDGRPIGRMTGNASVILQGKACRQTANNARNSFRMSLARQISQIQVIHR